VEKRLGWRALIVLAVLIVSFVYLVPSLLRTVPTWWSAALPTDKIHLGLDLQGGMHLILEVQTDKAVETGLESLGNDIKQILREKKVWVSYAHPAGKNGIVVMLKRPEDLNTLKEVVSDQFGVLSVEGTAPKDSGLEVRLALSTKESEQIRKMAVDQALETIRNRIDQFGVSEPDIAPQGGDRIIIQLPGVDDPKRAINLIGKTALLEFKLVDETADLKKAEEGVLPPNRELAYEIKVDKETGRKTKVPFVLEKRAVLTGRYLTDARVQIDNQFNEPYVSISFDKQGARLFERITGENVKRRLAIVLDGIVNSAPVINEKIAGGQARITGNFTMDEARDLAIVLRAGALPAPVTILEERTVGPSLGQDSINQGILSITVGLILVVFFMLIYYKIGGAIADVAVLLDILFIMAALAIFKATLTLPGIAGIILTIGMAVDANVLVFERIREEIRLGKTARAAVDGGFSKALVTILDANITTLIAALVLFQFGTGPVRGFAVTLSIGIAASLFTAIFVSRLIFDYLIIKRGMKTVSI